MINTRLFDSYFLDNHDIITINSLFNLFYIITMF